MLLPLLLIKRENKTTDSDKIEVKQKGEILGDVDSDEDKSSNTDQVNKDTIVAPKTFQKSKRNTKPQPIIGKGFIGDPSSSDEEKSESKPNTIIKDVVKKSTILQKSNFTLQIIG